MNLSKIPAYAIFLFFLFLFMNTLHAQYIIKQVEYKIPISSDMVPADKDFSNSADEAKYFLNLPDNKLDQKTNVKTMDLTIFIDGNNLATENVSPGGEKTSTITNSKKGMFYMVYWPRKTVMEMSAKDAEDMQKKAKAASDEAMKKLSPEMRKQIQEEEAKKKSQPQYQTKFTGKEKNINGFDCKQYMIQQGDEITMVWATDDSKGLSKHIEGISQKMKSLFDPGSTEKDEWELLPGKIPIVVRTYDNSMDGASIKVEEIKNISNKKPPAGVFSPPGKAQGFKTQSMKEMMMQMQHGMNGGDK